ncbi:hypothetical protein LJC51_01685 [Lachnospiraceae bacterium OttesenSCG-928-J05]|nr:hypothetical protein [Lachnospiraceae bacterium OttesenSCG-928-J05]
MKKRVMALLLSLLMLFNLFLIPGEEAEAADETVPVSWQMNDNSGHVSTWTQTFTATNNAPVALNYQLLNSNNDVIDGKAGTIGVGQTISVSCAYDLYAVLYVYEEDEYGEYEMGYGESIMQHDVKINTLVNGQVVESYDDIVDFGYNYTMEVPTIIEETVNGERKYFQLEGNGINLNQDYHMFTVSYGQKTYNFNYVPHEPAPVDAYVYLYNEESGSEIHKDGWQSKKPIAYDKTVEYEIPVEFESRGITYKLSDNQSANLQNVDGNDAIKKLVVGYFDEEIILDVNYIPQETEFKGAYEIKMYNIVKGPNGSRSVIGVRSATANTENADESQNIKYTPDKYVYIRNTNDSSVKMYELVGPTEINHNQADYKNKIKDIEYKLVDSKGDYEWRIVLQDITGGLKQVVRMPIKFDEATEQNPATYEAEEVITINGEKYVIASNQASKLTHKYGDNPTSYVNYNKVGVNVQEEYEVEVNYLNVTDNKMIETKTLKASVDNLRMVIQSPETIEVGESSYVRLNGQENEREHNYYSTRRAYTIYYRDINDEENADIIVTEEVIVEQPYYTDDGELVDGGTTTNTILTNESTGETEILDEGGVPLGEGLGSKSTAKDGEVPKATLARNTNTLFGSLPFIVGTIIAGLAILLTLVLFFAKRKKAIGEGDSSDQN